MDFINFVLFDFTFFDRIWWGKKFWLMLAKIMVGFSPHFWLSSLWENSQYFIEFRFWQFFRFWQTCRIHTKQQTTVRSISVTYHRLILHSVADLRGAALGSKFFQFHAVFGKIWQNRMLAPPWGVGVPSSGKYLIRHWHCTKFLV